MASSYFSTISGEKLAMKRANYCDTQALGYMPAAASAGRNEMDPPLCGSTAMSHKEFQIREPIEPQEASPMPQEMHVLGIAIAKRLCHALGMDDTGTIGFRKRLSRHDLLPCIAQLPPVLIGIAACGGAPDWARRFQAHGHTVKLMAPQFVKPYGATCKSLL
jgi:hypothetical protein